MSRSLFYVLIAMMPLIISGQEFINVEDLDIALAQQSYGAAALNKSVVGEPISVDGVLYQRGIGVHSDAVIKIKLNNGHQFKSKIGINDRQIDLSQETVRSIPQTDGKRVFYNLTASKKQFYGIEGSQGKVDDGSAVFIVKHNGVEVYNSGIMRQGDPAKMVDLEVRRGVLELIVENAGDGSSGDHAMWIEPTIEFLEISPRITNIEFTGNAITQDPEIGSHLSQAIEKLPKIDLPLPTMKGDWLIDNSNFNAGIYRTDNYKELVLTNGLIARRFRVVPNLTTVDYYNQMNGQSMLRAVSNEGILQIDGVEYTIGGLSSQPEYGYTLDKWIDNLTPNYNSFMVEDFEIRELTPRIEWNRVRWAANSDLPSGKELVFTLRKEDIVVKVHYALYDGIPTLSKWVEIINEGDIMVQLNKFKLESLAMVEGESLVGTPKHWVKPNIHIETNYAFGGMQQKNSDKTTYWEQDNRYTSQTNYPLNLPCLLEVKPPIGPDVAILPGRTFSTFRVWETPMDTREKERRGLFIRKMYRTISPWITENPIFMHLTTSDEETIRKAVDQCKEVGYEMIILSFGSGLNMEDESAENYAKFKRIVDYAKSQGIELGGYSLLSSRWISDEVDVINPETGKRGGMIFGSSPCLASEWGVDYFRKIKKFFSKTGMMVFENDGSYPGNVCASASHAHHHGLQDSQWKQYARIQDLYQWMRGKGIYMNVPDFYINSGTNKVGIGYREVNWSLPRDRQIILGRTNIYDGLWDRTPSMCWTFTPLTQYHGGGAQATIEPLHEHIEEYKMQMIQNYGSGVQSCYRGPRLYDTDETKQVVKDLITWYKQYREILNSDVIHLRRPSGRDWDGVMHVNPDLSEKGFALLYNPTDQDITRQITLPLYYTGISTSAKITEMNGVETVHELNRAYEIQVEITIAANSYNLLVVESLD